MRSWKQPALLGTCAVISAAAITGVTVSTTNAAPAPPEPKPVTVVNTPLPVRAPAPLRVKGSVNVANTPDVRVVGTPSVSVAGGSLAVTNGTAGPLRVVPDLGTIEPFNRTTSITINEGSACPRLGEVSGGVAGSRLVLQTISAHARLPEGQRPIEVQVVVSPQRYPAHLYVPMTLEGDLAGFSHSSGTATVQAYADGAHPLLVSACRTSTVGTGTVDVAVTGYLVHLP